MAGSRTTARQEETRRHEAALATALAKKHDPKKEYATCFGLGPFGQLPKKARKIIDCEGEWEVLRRMLMHKAKWVRSVEEWKPRGKSMHSILTSLITHLFCQYQMPAFWYSVWFTRAPHRAIRPDGEAVELDGTQLRDVDLFVRLAQGASLYKLIKEGLFLIPFTKKQCHAFMAQRSVKNPVSAVRWTQIQSFDGDRRLAQALCDTGWGDRFASGQRGEAFRAGIIQWFCNQGMIDPAQVGPLIDYIENVRVENPDWAIKGRTGQSLMRSMREWHDELAADRRQARRAGWASHYKPPPEKFDTCGVNGWRYNKKTKDRRSGGSIVEHWKIDEILTYEDLRNEGRELKHCVTSYAWSIARGAKAIYSLKCNHERLMTIEVHVATKTIVQARGYTNKMAEPGHIEHMRKWANDGGLLIAERAIRRRW